MIKNQLEGKENIDENYMDNQCYCNGFNLFVLTESKDCELMDVFKHLDALSVVISRSTESVCNYDHNIRIMGHFITKIKFSSHSSSYV
jgi:hypothetical protein